MERSHPMDQSLLTCGNSAGDRDREIWLAENHGRSRKLLSVAEPYGIGNLVWSPAGNRIAYQQFGLQGKLV
jgi:hypothetical protein